MSKMLLNVEMSEMLMSSMSRLVYENVEKAVRYCGSVHNFDADLMLSSMNLSVELSSKKSKSKSTKEKVVKEKVVKEKVVKSKVPMPFSGKGLENCCKALRQNHGLYTQCDTKVEDSEYCKKCVNGEKFGTIDQRLAVGLMEFRDPNGKAPTAYMKVLNKLKISREEAESEAGKLNIILDDIHFQEEKTEKKEKGRPKKAKKIIELEDDSTDLFAELVKNANKDVESDEEESNDEKSSIAESIIDTVLEKVSETVENNEKKAEKEAEKKQKKDAEKAEKEAAKLAEKEKKEAEKLAEKQKKEAEKAEKEAAKLAEKQKKEAEKAEKEAAKLAEKQKKEAEKKQKEAEKEKKADEKPKKTEEKKKKADEKPKKAEEKKKKDEEEEEEDVVKRFEFEGVKYLKSKKTGIIYNMDQDVIGKWNEKTGKIDFKSADSDSEEEEEEYDE